MKQQPSACAIEFDKNYKSEVKYAQNITDVFFRCSHFHLEKTKEW